MTLRAYQEAAILAFQARSDKRLIMAHATSAGKTLTAIRCAQAIGAKRILVCVPAMGRPTWVREFQKWAPELEPHSIRFGRERKNVTKAQVKERELAYAADIQVISYKLLKEIDDAPRDLLILDELHALRNPLSQQSKIVRTYRAKHPQLAMLGLTATPVPTDVKQLWCPLDTFWPGKWGSKRPNGDISWEFQRKYCYRTENEYGVAYIGSKSPEAMEVLANAIAPFVHRVTDHEVAPFLPPLHAEPLYLDEVRSEEDLAEELVDTARAEGTTHICIAAFNREVAWRIAAKLDTQYVVTGEKTAEHRQRIIDAAKMAASATLVVTSEAVNMAISLSFCQKAFIFQWRTAPAQAIQLMGRFPRQDAEDITRPSYIQYIVYPADEARAEVLSLRIKDIQQLMATDRKSEQLIEIFKPRELTESRLDSMFAQMMGRTNLDTEWEDDDAV